MTFQLMIAMLHLLVLQKLSTFVLTTKLKTKAISIYTTMLATSRLAYEYDIEICLNNKQWIRFQCRVMSFGWRQQYNIEEHKIYITLYMAINY